MTDDTRRDDDTTHSPSTAAGDGEACDTLAADAADTDADEAAVDGDRETVVPDDVAEARLDASPASRSESGASRVAGVLLIVLLTLVAAGLGAALGPLIHPTAGRGDVSGLDARIAALESKVGDLEGLGQQLDTATGEIKTLDGRVASLESGTGASTGDGTVAGGGDLDALDQRLAALESATSALAAQVGGGIDQRIATLDSRLSMLEGSGAAPDGGTDGSTADGTATDTTSLSAEIAALQQKIAALSDQVGTDGGGQPVEARIADMEQRLAGLSDATAGLAALENQVKELASRATDPRVAYALAVGQLRESVLAGESYEDALKAATALVPDGDTGAATELATLEAWQSTGVVSRGRLADALGAASFAAVDAARVDSAEGWFDKTVAELATIVSVRRVDGEIEGDDAEAVTARAEARLRQGDLAGAIAEMEKLTGSAAAAAAGWLEMAKSRAAAEAAVDALSADAIALIGGAAGS